MAPSSAFGAPTYDQRRAPRPCHKRHYTCCKGVATQLPKPSTPYSAQLPCLCHPPYGIHPMPVCLSIRSYLCAPHSPPAHASPSSMPICLPPRRAPHRPLSPLPRQKTAPLCVPCPPCPLPVCPTHPAPCLCPTPPAPCLCVLHTLNPACVSYAPCPMPVCPMPPAPCLCVLRPLPPACVSYAPCPLPVCPTHPAPCLCTYQGVVHPTPPWSCAVMKAPARVGGHSGQRVRLGVPRPAMAQAGRQGSCYALQQLRLNPNQL